MADIDAAIQDEIKTRQGATLKESFLREGNFTRFCIAFVVFLLQQWGGQNSIKWVGRYSVRTTRLKVFLVITRLKCLHQFVPSCKVGERDSSFNNPRSDTLALKIRYWHQAFME